MEDRRRTIHGAVPDPHGEEPTVDLGRNSDSPTTVTHNCGATAGIHLSTVFATFLDSLGRRVAFARPFDSSLGEVYSSWIDISGLLICVKEFCRCGESG